MEDASINGYKDSLIEAIRLFQCVQDSDVQDFLNNKAIDFEIRGWATTYLLLSEKEWFDGNILIEGYFSLNHKAVLFDEGVSRSARGKISGNKDAQMESFVLIGQLGKRMECSGDLVLRSELTAKDLLDDALSVIEHSSDYIICRNVIIECKPIEKVKRIYENYGFSSLQYNESTSLYMLYLKLKNKVKFDDD